MNRKKTPILPLNKDVVVQERRRPKSFDPNSPLSRLLPTRASKGSDISKDKILADVVPSPYNSDWAAKRKRYSLNKMVGNNKKQTPTENIDFEKKVDNALHNNIKPIQHYSSTNSFETENILSNNELFRDVKSTPRITSFRMKINKAPVQRLYLRRDDDKEKMKRRKRKQGNDSLYQPLGAIIFAGNEFGQQVKKEIEKKEDDYSKYREEYDSRNYVPLTHLREKLNSSQSTQKGRDKTRVGTAPASFSTSNTYETDESDSSLDDLFPVKEKEKILLSKSSIQLPSLALPLKKENHIESTRIQYESRTGRQNQSMDLNFQEPLKLQYDPSQLQGPSLPMNISNQTAVKDFLLIAQACNRAGRNRMEGLTHYRLGCQFELFNEMKKASKHYNKFLRVSQVLNDNTGICLAYNCLGVLQHKWALIEPTEEGQHLEKALFYHMKHWELADTQGKVVAHINMGRVCQLMGDSQNASEHYKAAYKYAVEIGDSHGESIALANLGILVKELGDLENAQSLIGRHLELSKNMKDAKSSLDAYHQLGLLAAQKGDDKTALHFFNKAREVALENEDQSKANKLKCNIGIVSGNVAFEQFMQQLSKEFVPSTDQMSKKNTATATTANTKQQSFTAPSQDDMIQSESKKTINESAIACSNEA
jgi:tetratricopeptide (TPR) repeat protein